MSITQSDIENLIGPNRVDNLSNIDRDTNAVTKAATQAARIAECIAYSDGIAEMIFRGSTVEYPVTANSTTASAFINTQLAAIAAYRLYLPWGHDDKDPLGNKLKALYNDAVRTLGLIASGTLKLDVVRDSEVPTVPKAI